MVNLCARRQTKYLRGIQLLSLTKVTNRYKILIRRLRYTDILILYL